MKFVLTQYETTGIKIDQAVTAACTSQVINLSTASASSFNQVINQIAVTAGNRTVTSAVAAQDHITASMAGLASGTFVLPPITSTGGYVATNTIPTGDYSPAWDNGDGTVTVNGDIWLKNANCWRDISFSDCRESVANLASGQCGLTDNSKAGDWVLPSYTQLINIYPYRSLFINVPQVILYQTQYPREVVIVSTGELSDGTFDFAWPCRKDIGHCSSSPQITPLE